MKIEAHAIFAALGVFALSGCNEYSSFLDCANSELKGATTRLQQEAAVAYCRQNYEITDEERETIQSL